MAQKCGCGRPAPQAVCDACAGRLHAAAEAKNDAVVEWKGKYQELAEARGEALDRLRQSKEGAADVRK